MLNIIIREGDEVYKRYLEDSKMFNIICGQHNDVDITESVGSILKDKIHILDHILNIVNGVSLDDVLSDIKIEDLGSFIELLFVLNPTYKFNDLTNDRLKDLYIKHICYDDILEDLSVMFDEIMEKKVPILHYIDDFVSLVYSLMKFKNSIIISLMIKSVKHLLDELTNEDVSKHHRILDLLLVYCVDDFVIFCNIELILKHILRRTCDNESDFKFYMKYVKYYLNSRNIKFNVRYKPNKVIIINDSTIIKFVKKPVVNSENEALSLIVNINNESHASPLMNIIHSVYYKIRTEMVVNPLKVESEMVVETNRICMGFIISYIFVMFVMFVLMSCVIGS